MADKFYAATKIQYGKRTEDGSQDGKYEQTVFEEGDEVTGLPADEMKTLWNQGALRREKAADDTKSDDTKSDDDSSKTPTKSTPAKATPAKAANPS